jgi:hypothetical protein
MFGQSPRTTTTDLSPTNDQFYQQSPPSFVDPYDESSSNTMLNNKNFLSSNILLKRIMEKHNASHLPIGANARNFYSHLNLMSIKWTQSLSQRKLKLFFLFHKNLRKNFLEDKCIVFFVAFSATILILAHICGVLTVSLSSNYSLLNYFFCT